MTLQAAHAPLIGIAARTRKSPYFEATMRWGAKAFTVYNHMLMPLWYESPQADYWKLMTNVTMWDVAVERQVEITGPDAARLVQTMTPRNLSKCKVGQCKYVPIVAEDGGVINDPVLLKLGETHFWLSLADSDVLLWVRGLAHGLGLNVTITEPDVSPLAIQGPRADEVAARLLGDWVRDLRFFWFREFDLDGIPLLVARSGWSKQGGVELYLRNGRFGTDLWERVAEAGKPFDIAPAAPSTIERIESGLLSWGNDVTLDDNPFEVGLGHYCDLDQEADFVGKAALRQIRAAGLTRKLVGVTMGEVEQPGTEHWWPLTDDSGERVGEVRSATYSPRLQQMIGLAMVRIDKTAVHTPLTAHAPWGNALATIAAVPFAEKKF